MRSLLFLCSLSISVSLFAQTAAQTTYADSLYRAAGVDGTFYLLRVNGKQTATFAIHPEATTAPVIPASTFKVPNTIIALEMGIVSGEDHFFEWDGVTRSIANWNKSQTLKEAYGNSTVWIYQQLARSIGYDRYREWLRILDYGNQSTGGGIDQFWLTGDLRISCVEQTAFLRKLNEQAFPLKASTYAAMQHIMGQDLPSGIRLYSKTGWADTDSLNTGWFIGYFEHGGATYYFAHLLRVKVAPEQFASLRKQIAFQLIELLTGITVP